MGGQGGWEQRSEACVKIPKKKWGVGSGGRVGGGSGWGGGQGGCEWRSEAFVKFFFFFFLFIFFFIFFFFFGGGGGSGQRGGRVGLGGQGGW